MVEQLFSIQSVNDVPPSPTDRFRYPEILVSNGYLNDPIKFTADQRFLPRTVVQQLEVLENVAERDLSNFIKVDGSLTTPQYITINTVTPIWNRLNYNRVISQERRQFTEL